MDETKFKPDSGGTWHQEHAPPKVHGRALCTKTFQHKMRDILEICKAKSPFQPLRHNLLVKIIYSNWLWQLRFKQQAALAVSFVSAASACQCWETALLITQMLSHVFISEMHHTGSWGWSALPDLTSLVVSLSCRSQPSQVNLRFLVQVLTLSVS